PFFPGIVWRPPCVSTLGGTSSRRTNWIGIFEEQTKGLVECCLQRANLMDKPDSGIQRSRKVRARRALASLLGAVLLLPPPLSAADLEPKTVEAFNHYVQLTEAQMDSQLAAREPFLRVDTLPADRRAAALAQLREGKVVIEQLETLDHGKPIAVPGGLIHHWIGTVFIPGATLAQTLSFEQDFDRHQDYFRPDVIRSKILRHDGSDFLVQLRFYKKKIISTILDT